MAYDLSKFSHMGNVEIDSHGRFAIPEKVRETIGIKKQVSWFSYGNCLVLIPKQHLFEELTESIREVVLSEGKEVKDIESKLPHAGENAFCRRYGSDLADKYKKLLKGSKDESS